MQLAPAIIIHSLEDARIALAPGRPVTLLSAPGAVRFGGCLWWARLIEASGFTGAALLDCADAPGRALEALKTGGTGLVLTCDPARFALVAEIAASQGVLLLPVAPPALDLAQSGAQRRLLNWLDDTG